MRKRIVIGVLSIALIATLSIGGTLAFLTDSEKAVNSFDIANLDIKLEEPNWSVSAGENLSPGDTKIKDPTVTNIESDSYMRVVMRIIDDSPESPDYNKVITDQERIDKIFKLIYFDSSYNAERTPVTINIVPGNKYSLSELSAYPTVNEDFELDKTKSSAGVYYYNYNHIFRQGEKAVLFSNIAVPKDFTHSDITLLGKFRIELYAQAIQSKNFADSNEAFAALDAEMMIN